MWLEHIKSYILAKKKKKPNKKFQMPNKKNAKVKSLRKLLDPYQVCPFISNISPPLHVLISVSKIIVPTCHMNGNNQENLSVKRFNHI